MLFATQQSCILDQEGGVSVHLGAHTPAAAAGATAAAVTYSSTHLQRETGVVDNSSGLRTATTGPTINAVVQHAKAVELVNPD